MTFGWKAILKVAIVAAFLLCVFLINPNVFGNRRADVDTWYYLGHFLTLGEFRNVDSGIPYSYYETRLPYILPGYLIFSIFSEPVAKFAAALLVAFVVLASFFHLVRDHFSDRVAVAATCLLASDIFFIRAVGWNYVDNGVLAYAALTFLTLNIASKQNGNAQRIYVALAAFCFISMIFVHLGAAMVGIGVIVYAAYLRLLSIRRLDLVLSALLGVAVCQVIYGLANMMLWSSNFFFLITQLQIGQIELRQMPQWKSLAVLFQSADWIAIPIGVWLASAVLLLGHLVSAARLHREQLYFLAAAFLTLTILLAMEYFRIGLFLGRQGLYITFFFVSIYLALASLLQKISNWAVWSLALVCAGVLAVRLIFDGDFRGSFVPQMPIWPVSLAVAAALITANIVSNAVVSNTALVLLPLCSLLLGWQFIDTSRIYEARRMVQRLSGSEIPIFLIDKDDPSYIEFTSLVAAFTERALWLHGDQFPVPANIVVANRRVVVLTSQIERAEDAKAMIEPHVQSIALDNSVRMPSGEPPFFIHSFRITNRIGIPGESKASPVSKEFIPAAQLLGLVGKIDGTRRVADGTMPGGALTYGPYARLAAGMYEISISYATAEASHSWDVVYQKTQNVTETIKSAQFFQPSQDKVVTMITLPTDIRGFQVRSFFSGQGQLTVHGIGIRPLDK